MLQKINSELRGDLIENKILDKITGKSKTLAASTKTKQYLLKLITNIKPKMNTTKKMTKNN